MSNGVTRPERAPGRFGLAFAGMTVLAAACASGGSGPPLPRAEAEALFADLSGVWVLDEESSSPPMMVTPDPPPGTGSLLIIKGSDGQGIIVGDIPEEREAPRAIRKATLEVLGWRPGTLALRVDGTMFVYRPSPGENVQMAIAGGSASRRVARENVHTKVFWEGGKLGLEHSVGALGKVREVFEVVDGRLVMTRTMRLIGETVLPVVLVYDREG